MVFGKGLKYTTQEKLHWRFWVNPKPYILNRKPKALHPEPYRSEAYRADHYPPRLQPTQRGCVGIWGVLDAQLVCAGAFD